MTEILTTLSDNEKEMFQAKILKININEVVRTFDYLIKEVTYKQEEKNTF